MGKNLRKGSKVLISVSGRGLKRTQGIVKSATEDFVDVKVTCGFAKGKVFMRKPKEVKRRSR